MIAERTSRQCNRCVFVDPPRTRTTDDPFGVLGIGETLARPGPARPGLAWPGLTAAAAGVRIGPSLGVLEDLALERGVERLRERVVDPTAPITQTPRSAQSLA